MSTRAVAAALVCAVAAGAARADVDVSIDWAHDGATVSEAATPLRVRLRNSADSPVRVRIEIEPPAELGGSGFRVERDVVIGASAEREEAFLVPAPSGWVTSGAVTVASDDGTTIRSRAKVGDRGRLRIPHDQFVRSGDATIRPAATRAVGVVGDSASVLANRLHDDGNQLTDAMNWAQGQGRRYGTAFIPVSDAALAIAPLGLDGIAGLVVLDPTEEFCADPQALDGLLDWVALGGRLVVSLGQHAAGFAKSPLAEHLPATWTTSERGPIAPAMRSLGLRSSTRIESAVADLAPARDAAIRVPGAWSETAYGSGSIAVAAFDLRAAAADVGPDDRALGDPLRALVLPAAAQTPWASTPAYQLAPYDVAGRVGRALQQDAFRPPPLLAVLLALIAYVAVVGPADWFILRRLKKERLTTFTFAGAVITFTVLAYGVSLFLFAADAVVNRVTFVRYADGGRGGREVVRYHDLCGFYAPTPESYRLRTSMASVALGSSLPGQRAAGGLGTTTDIVVRGNDPLRSESIVDVPFRSQRVVHTTGAGPVGRTVRVTRSTNGLVVENDLPSDLADVVVWVQEPGRSAPTLHRASFVAAGGTATLGVAEQASPYVRDDVQDFGGLFGGSPPPEDELTVRRFLAGVVTSACEGGERPPWGWDDLALAGIAVLPPKEGRALLVATSDRVPVDVPESRASGRAHVVVVKEFELP